MAAQTTPTLSPLFKRSLIAIGFAVAAYGFIRFAAPLLAPFLLGLVISVLIEPIVRLLVEWKVKRSVAVVVVLLVAVVLFSALGIFVIGQVITELEQLVRLIPKYEKEITQWSTRIIAQWRDYYERLPLPVMEALNSSGDTAYDWAVGILQSLLNGVKAIPNLFMTLLMAFLTTYFVSKDKTDAYRAIEGWTSQTVGRQEAWQKVLSFRRSAMKSGMSYIRAQLILMALTVVVVLVMLLVMKIKYAWLIALASGLLDVLPMLGPAAIFVPWAFVMLVTGSSEVAAKLMVTLVVAMGVRQLSEARVVGQSIGVHPLFTLMSLYICVKVFGLSGFVIGPAVIIIGRALWKANLVNLGR